MKRSILFLLCSILLLFSCGKDEISVCEDCAFTCLDEEDTDVITNDCKENWDCNFRVFDQSKVDIALNEGVGEGNKNVFQVYHSTQGSQGIADDEFTGILVFELDKSQTSFSAEGDDLKSMKTHYRGICFCINVDFIEATSGCMQGEKQLDGSWFIQGDLEFNSLPFKFDGRFK